jgi:cytochrome c-type biogenesis protein
MVEQAPNLAISFVAGLLSFLSPCVVPLIPSYITFIGGVTLTDLRGEHPRRGPLFAKTAAFVVGFGTVFVALGVLFSGTGFLFSGASTIVNLVAGGIVIVLGLNVMFNFWNVLNMEKRMHVTRRPAGLLGAFLVGMAFGGGWSPCVGPILAGILVLAGQSGQVAQGVLLLSVYSLGLGLPFLLASLFFTPFLNQLNRIRKHLNTIRIVSGGFLVAIGVLIAVGRLQQLNIALFRLAAALQQWDAARPVQAKVVLALITLVIAVLPFIPVLIRRVRAKRRDVDLPEGKTRVFRPIRSVFAGALTLVAVLHVADVLDLATVLYGWLTFQGI